MPVSCQSMSISFQASSMPDTSSVAEYLLQSDDGHSCAFWSDERNRRMTDNCKFSIAPDCQRSSPSLTAISCQVAGSAYLLSEHSSGCFFVVSVCLQSTALEQVGLCSEREHHHMCVTRNRPRR